MVLSKRIIFSGSVDPGSVDPGSVDPGSSPGTSKIFSGSVDPGLVDPGSSPGTSKIFRHPWGQKTILLKRLFVKKTGYEDY